MIPSRPRLNEHREPDAGLLAQHLASEVGALLSDAIAKRGVALLGVSGGRSPVAFFHALSQQRIDIVEQIGHMWRFDECLLV